MNCRPLLNIQCGCYPCSRTRVAALTLITLVIIIRSTLERVTKALCSLLPPLSVYRHQRAIPSFVCSIYVDADGVRALSSRLYLAHLRLPSTSGATLVNPCKLKPPLCPIKTQKFRIYIITSELLLILKVYKK